MSRLKNKAKVRFAHRLDTKFKSVNRTNLHPRVKKGYRFLKRNKKGGVILKQITKEMLRIYEPVSKLDWMNYRLVRKDVTFHHIVKRCEGGKETIENGALLMPIPHQYLHLIEFKDIKTYNAINKIFRYVNQQGYEPTEEQREIVEYLLSEFETAHEKDKNSKGKPLIKAKYLIRGV